MSIRHWRPSPRHAVSVECWPTGSSGSSARGPKWWALRGEAKAGNAGPMSASSVGEDLHAVAMEVTRRIAVAESQEINA